MVDFVKNLEIPCCFKLGECFQDIENPDYKKSIKYCSRVIEKNVGICMGDPLDKMEVMRSKAFWLRGKGY